MNSIFQLRGLRIAECWLWGRILCLLLSLVLPVTCFALEIRRVQTCSGIVLRLRGDIKEGDFSQLRSHFRRKGTIVGFDLSSDGGIFEEGLRIADLTRRKNLTVYVAGECNSACSDIFFAAAKRYFEADSKIGIHAVSNDRNIEDVGSKILTIKLARLWAEQGISNSVIGKMVTTRPETIIYLDRTDLSDLDASAGNPFAYKDEKSSEAGQAPQQSCALTKANCCNVGAPVGTSRISRLQQ
jgi:hypothetical protein